jgi:N-methylhydantoinase A
LSYVVGIDVGGTFTDCVLVSEDGSVFTDKSFTVPSNPGQGMLDALGNVVAPLAIGTDAVLAQSSVVAIGTTSITNKLITRGGAKVGLITTKGHEDAVFIGRVVAKTEGLSESQKDDFLEWSKPEPIVAPDLIVGISERIDYKGKVVVALDHAEVALAVRGLLERGVEAIAVSLLWSFVNPLHERWIKEYVEREHPGTYVALGSTVAPVLGEYERTNTTLLSAHLGSLARREMDVTARLLNVHGLGRSFLVMQSNGGCMWSDEVEVRPLNLIASGPAGGIIGSAKIGVQMGYPNVIATDMGGTSFDVGVITDGAALLSDIAVHDRTRLALPHVDVVSIGAGGGSIAWVDPATGTFHVGPQSAGSVPGPVAYDQGGTEPTVTDADIVLGRIDPARFFNGRKLLDRGKAEAAIETMIARPLGCDVLTAARGIVDIVDSRMGDLIRKLTVERGVDPRDFVIFAYGGAGPTHVGGYGREAGSALAVVSPYASVFSALGIAAADIVRVYSNSRPMRSPFNPGQMTAVFAQLEANAREELARRSVEADSTALSRSVEMRFRHQVHQIKVSVPHGELTAEQIEVLLTRFIALFEQSFGRGTTVTAAGMEILTFQVVATTRHTELTIKETATGNADPSAAVAGKRAVFFGDAVVETPIFEQARLACGNKIVGPAIVEGANTTLPLHPGQSLTVDRFGNLVIHFPEQGA